MSAQRRNPLEEALLQANYNVLTQQEFQERATLPAGLLERARKAGLLWHKFVVYDPLDDVDGFMLWGDKRPALVSEAYKFLKDAEKI